jgi:nitroimidazol reductase NimA-like FMN-containing flavoprotein (pyridoxamine 5'-phosphate oxidase superfamily)/GNAT superfamily N-acetyltransferase
MEKPASNPPFPPPLSSTDRTRLRRHPERGHTDRATLDAILDAGWVVHIAFDAGGGQPIVIPTTYVRHGDHLYVHGAIASGMLRAAGAGPVCATVTLLDGLVLARSAFHHSMNYRSAVILGRARPVTDEGEKKRVLEAMIERFIPGRMETARAPSPEELKTTSVLALPLDEASVKIRTGPPIDGERDVSWPAWAGVIPLALTSGPPAPAEGTVGVPPKRTLAGPVARAMGIGHADAHADADGNAEPLVEQRFGEITLSDDRARVDFARVTGWLAGSYWCPGIPRAAVERAARCSSLVAGAYDAGGEQIGYLRVVSDCTRFANLMDVFVAERHRGRGLGRALVRFALAHPAHREIARWMLGTKDAHGVYAPEGFGPVAEPDRLMQRIIAPPWSTP